MNIFVGDNATGKSSILQALDIVLTGSITRVMTIGLENLINVEVVSSWLENPRIDNLPIMSIELFFEMPNNARSSRYNGEKFMDSHGQSLYGIKLLCLPNPDYNEDITHLIQTNNITAFPFEFYSISFSTFSDMTYTGYLKPCKSLYIDNTTMNTTRTLKYVVDRTYHNAVDENERTSEQYDFRQHLSNFTLPQTAIEKNLTITGDLESCLDIKENGISLANQGEGKISICKTDSALDRSIDNISILAIEEPENHLSHYSLRHLISQINERAGDRQMFIVTHNSYITSRLGLRNTFFVSPGHVTPLNQLSTDTSSFFMKAPNDNLLQFVLSKKVLLVEGAAEYILMDKFIQITTGRLTSDNNIWIMALNNLSFRRYLEVGRMLDIKVAAVRDNDGNPQIWYADLQDNHRKVFSDSSVARYTFEVCLHQDNEAVLKNVFSNFTSDQILDYMLQHKAEAAYQILKSDVDLVVPSYIKEAIEWLII